jgi:hypothetical protein
VSAPNSSRKPFDPRQHATIKWTRSRQCFGTLSAEIPPVRQLIKAKDVALKLGVSISWVVFDRNLGKYS